MTNLLNKFSEAAKVVSSSKTHTERVNENETPQLII